MTEAAKQYLAKKNLERMERGNAYFGLFIGGLMIFCFVAIFYCVITQSSFIHNVIVRYWGTIGTVLLSMGAAFFGACVLAGIFIVGRDMLRKAGVLVIVIMLAFTAVPSEAGELDAWEFNIMGINPKDFEGRNWWVAAGGAVVSLAVHELGHVATARWMGTDSYFDWHERKAYAGDGYETLSNDQKALYHGGGFLFQTAVGGVLTAIPKTRHADFTLGFNTFSSINGFFYGITGGMDEDSSDVDNLDKYGYNGTAIALGSGLINGVFTYYSLDKHKED